MAGTNADFYSLVQRRIWNDAGFRKLSKPAPNARDLFLYLLISPHATQIPGLIAIGESAMAEDLEWPVTGLRKALGELEAVGMVKVDRASRLLWLPNGIKHNPPKSPDNVLGWGKHWRMLPECELLAEASAAMMEAFVARGGAFPSAFSRVTGLPMPPAEEDPVDDPPGEPEPYPMGSPEPLPPPRHQTQESQSQADPGTDPGTDPESKNTCTGQRPAAQLSLLAGDERTVAKKSPRKTRGVAPQSPSASSPVQAIWRTVWQEASMPGPAPWDVPDAATAKRYLDTPGASIETAKQAIVGMLRTEAGHWHRTHEGGRPATVRAALTGSYAVTFTAAGKQWLAAQEAAARPKREPPPARAVPKIFHDMSAQDAARGVPLAFAHLKPPEIS